jgi:hypothetical protein
VKAIHPTDLAEIQTDLAQWHLPMIPSCRTRESPVARNKWILRGEITTNLLHNDSASMDGDADNEDAKVQNTKAVTGAALGAKCEILFLKMLPYVNSLSFSATLSTSCMLSLQQQQQLEPKSRFKSGVSPNWENPLL